MKLHFTPRDDFIKSELVAIETRPMQSPCSIAKILIFLSKLSTVCRNTEDVNKWLLFRFVSWI